MLPRKAEEGMELKPYQILDLIYHEIEATPEDSELCRLNDVAQIVFSKQHLRSREFKSNSTTCKLTNFMYYTVLGLSHDHPTVLPIESLSYESLSEKLTDWLKKEAYFSRERYLKTCEEKSIVPVDTSLRDWETAKNRSLEFIGLHFSSC
jgi:hypothetical protein